MFAVTVTESSAPPLRTTVEVAMVWPSVCEVTVRIGAVLSMVNVTGSSVVVFPASSVAEATSVCGPSALTGVLLAIGLPSSSSFGVQRVSASVHETTGTTSVLK